MRIGTASPHSRAGVSKDGGGPMLRDASPRNAAWCMPRGKYVRPAMLLSMRP
jgi:hypothetical protein